MILYVFIFSSGLCAGWFVCALVSNGMNKTPSPIRKLSVSVGEEQENLTILPKLDPAVKEKLRAYTIAEIIQERTLCQVCRGSLFFPQYPGELCPICKLANQAAEEEKP